MPRGLFVTGTDTGVGKTVVTCAIAAALHRRGLRVGVYKPVETGCRVDGGTPVGRESGTRVGQSSGRRVGEDCERLAAAAGARQRPSDVASYLLLEPAAPLVAAEAEGIVLDHLRLTADFARIAGACDFVLVESAGGLLVPITETFGYRDLAAELGLPVVCVVASRLGCINHALLTIEAARAAGLAVAGYVMNEIAEDEAHSLALRTNAGVLARTAAARALGTFPRAPDPSPAALADLAEERLDLAAIL